MSRHLPEQKRARPWCRWALALTLLIFLTACRAPAMGPGGRADLNEAGWVTQRGQAVWQPRRQAPELAGDWLAARHPDGRWLVQFAKPPLTLCSAQGDGRRWEISFGSRRFRGMGEPTRRCLWMFWPRLLAGQTLPDKLVGQARQDGGRLENPRTGESIEGVVFP